jgi:hypothetical protein
MCSIALGAWTVLAGSTALADVVQLQDGNQITGTFTEASAGIVSIEVGGQIINFAQDKVRAIYFGALPVAAPPVAAPPVAAPPAGAAAVGAPAVVSRSAPAAPPAPNPAMGEAVDALKALHSVAVAGADYDKYSARLADAKTKVERFLQSEPADSPARGAVSRALQFYALAATAWNGRLTNGTAQLPEVGRDPLLQHCDDAQQVLKKYAQNHKSDQTFGTGYTDGLTIAISGLPALWSCGAREIAALDKPAAPPSPDPPASPRAIQNAPAPAVQNAPAPAPAPAAPRTSECPPGFALNESKKMCIRQP